MTAQNGLSATIREYVAKHHECFPHKVAKAIGHDARLVAHCMAKQAKSGYLIAHDREGFRRHYTLGVPVKHVVGKTPEERARIRREAQLRRNLVRRVPEHLKRPKPAKQPTVKAPRMALEAPRSTPAPTEAPKRVHLSSDDFIAAGGKIERLPSSEVPRKGWPRPMFHGASW